MNYKPTLIVLTTFIIGMVVGLLVAGLVIRQQLQPVRNLQTAKGIKKMVTQILESETDTANQAMIFEILDENLAEMQALDLEYRSEMQINMDSLAKDLIPLLSDQQAENLQNRIAENRQTIEKRFEKSKRLKELEQRIVDLELQLTEQIEEDKQTQTSSPNRNKKPTNSKSSSTSNPAPKQATPSLPKSTTSSAFADTDIPEKRIVDRPFLRDILRGYYGGNPRLINAFFLLKFEGDTAQFQNYIQQHFTGDTQQLRRVLSKHFRNKNRLRNLHRKQKFRNKQKQLQNPNFPNRNRNKGENLPRQQSTSKNPPTIPPSKEQTLENESIIPDTDPTNTPTAPTNPGETFLEKNEPTNSNPPPSNSFLTPADELLMNRILQRRFSGDTLSMREFIVNRFEGDSLLFIQETRQRIKNQRKRRQERRN